jgi:hypothetical protein
MERRWNVTVPWHYYPLFRLYIDERWIFYIDVDRKGEIRIGMMFIAGDLFEAMATGKLTPPPKCFTQ